MVPLRYSRGRSTRYCDRLHEFSVTIPRCCKDVNVYILLKVLKSGVNTHVKKEVITHGMVHSPQSLGGGGG